MPIVVNGGTATFEEAVIPDLEIRGENANLRFNGSVARDVVVVGDTSNTIHAADTTFRNLDLTDVDDKVDLAKVRIYAQLKALRVNKIKADIWVTAGGGAEAAIDITDCAVVALKGIVEGAGRESIRFEDVTSFGIAMEVLSTPSADNTYDAVSLQGVCGPGRIYGSIRGAVDPDAGTNNPRYCLAIAAGCVDIEYDLELSGYQTGAVNNLAGLEVATHARVSTETPDEDDVLVWDDTNQIWRPEPGAGVGGGVDELDELTDVDLTDPPDEGQVLTYEGGVWVASDPTAGGGGGQAMREDEDPDHADGDTFPGTSLDGSWTESKSNGSDPSEVNRGAYWVGTIAVSGASSFRTVSIYKAVTLAVGDTLIACVEQFTLGDNESLIGIQMMDASTSDAAGIELEQSSGETSLIRYYSQLSGVKTAVYSERSESFARRFWIGVKHTATNEYQPYASLNGTLWVPVAAASAITLTPARVLFTSGSFNTGGPTLGACHLIDIVTTI